MTIKKEDKIKTEQKETMGKAAIQFLLDKGLTKVQVCKVLAWAYGEMLEQKKELNNGV